ncbi:MAG TPA: methyltransferase domain-containing protein [Cyclobacteriaceae bacterium]|jgi:SAM-dependent methyltransferase|nr:methyltransferase domain-containing protein [Cyclobacteriaceae bacterium]
MSEAISYTHTTKIHNTRAATIVVPHLLQLFRVDSVLDVGCGLGTWLTVFRDKGVTDIVGLDGSNVDMSMICIPPENFRVHDLRTEFDLQRRFDLVLCLEVAEHLPESCAEPLVASLCRHSDHIVFSAAIPGQGGQNHINEQWPEYWRSLFEREGYTMLDVIRPTIWNNPGVDAWYRQNMFVYTKDRESVSMDTQKVQMAEIHPVFWLSKVEALAKQADAFDQGRVGIRRSFRALVNAIWNKLKRR